MIDRGLTHDLDTPFGLEHKDAVHVLVVSEHILGSLHSAYMTV